MMLAVRRLDQIAKHRAAAESSSGGRMPAGAARGDVVAGLPPIVTASPTPIGRRLAPTPIGQTGSGPLWSIEPVGGRNVELIGPGVSVTLCPSSQGAIQAALSAVIAAEGGQS